MANRVTVQSATTGLTINDIAVGQMFRYSNNMDKNNTYMRVASGLLGQGFFGLYLRTGIVFNVEPHASLERVPAVRIEQE